MQSIYIYVTKEQKNFFKERKNKTGIPESVQMREAFDMYIEKINKKS